MRYEKSQDLVLIFYVYNEVTTIFESENKIFNAVHNLSTCISFDGDLLFVGDAFKNVTVLKKCNEEEIKKERLENTNLIHI